LLCGVELTDDSPDLVLELGCDDERLFYCAECWEREFGEHAARDRVTLRSAPGSGGGTPGPVSDTSTLESREVSV
jgi:hypothetical protein